MVQQVIVFGTLFAALLLFIQGRWRYDVVALLALMVVVVAGIVPGKDAFAGFGHPAVVTVAAVLVISRGLSTAGLVDLIARWLSLVGNRIIWQMSALLGLVVIASAFMNNVGALALLMPVAVRMARKNSLAPSLFLMPLAFGSLLGGLITLIGTPPNIIIATFRTHNGSVPFRMFDFAPVGLGVALLGVFFTVLVGWRLLPQRKGQGSRDELFQIEAYTTEVRVTENSKIVGKTLRQLEVFNESDIVAIGLVRGEQWLSVPSSFEVLKAGDVLVLEADSKDLEALVDAAKLELVGSKELCKDFLGLDEETLKVEEEARGERCDEILGLEKMDLIEAVVKLGSPMIGKTVRSLNLRWRYGMNLLAVARQGTRLKERLQSIRFAAGDVLLLQGPSDTMQDALNALGCFPLAERDVHIGERRRALLSVVIFGAAVVAATLGLLPVQIALVAAAVLMLLTGVLNLRSAYDSIDWPIIVLLGAMIPVGQALESTGGAQTVANKILDLAGQMPAGGTLVILLIATMLLSNLINNAATAVLMAPIALSVAQGMNVSIDPFLMIVAVGSSTPFLTPIGHQSNTLVMGPGGYRFGDYWRMGLPLSILVILTAVPLVMWIWPL